MIEISDELKKSFNSDVGDKELILEFYKNYDDTKPAYVLRNKNIISESMELNEGISTEQDIRYGQCYSSRFSVEIFDLTQTLGYDFDFIGYKLKAFIKIKNSESNVKYIYPKDNEEDSENLYPNDNLYPIGSIELTGIPLFVGVVKNSELKDNRNNRRLTAYDILSEKLNTDITNLFWNDLINNRTVKYIRTKILEKLQIPYEDVTLINDETEFHKNFFEDIYGKTKSNTKIIARKALESILEICGCFGHINRYGIFEFKSLKNIKYLYPTNEYAENVKYPSNTLFPGIQDPNIIYTVDYPTTSDSENVKYPNDKLYAGVKRTVKNKKDDSVDLDRNYIKCRYGEFVTNNITGVELINKDDIIIDAYISSNNNIYVSKGNLFIDQQIDNGDVPYIFSQDLYIEISNNIYTPYTLECIGMPYVEVGDYVTFKPANDDKGNSPITVPILSRTLKGIQSLKDTYSAKGTEDRTQRI